MKQQSRGWGGVRGPWAKVLAVSGMASVLAVACTSTRGPDVARGAQTCTSSGPLAVSVSRAHIQDLDTLVCDPPPAMAVSNEAVKFDDAKLTGTFRNMLNGKRLVPDMNTSSGWTWSTPAPAAGVETAPAIYVPSYPNSSNNDLYFVSTDASGATNFFALTGIYGTTPSTKWSASTGGGTNGGWIEFDANLNAYVVDTKGVLYCFNPTTGGICTNWTKQSYTAATGANGGQYTSPWWSYDQSAIYFGDNGGYLHKVYASGASAGKKVWDLNLANLLGSTACAGAACNPFAVHSSPIVYNGHIYVGVSGGAFFDIIDTTGTTAPTAAATTTWLCGTPVGAQGCNSGSSTAWDIVNSASLDTSTGTNGTAYAAANGKVFEFTLGTATTASSLAHTVTLLSGASAAVYSSPIVDRTNKYVYVGYNNSLYKLKYPFTSNVTCPSGTACTSVALQNAGTNASYPRSTPLPWNGAVFIGDAAGVEERYTCLTSTSAPQLNGLSSTFGTQINSSAVVDFSTGDVNFGFSNSGTGGGGAAQLPMTASGSFTCGSGGLTCATGCGGSTSVCIEGSAQCCTSSDCGTVSNGTTSCTNNTCSITCSGSRVLCGTQCIKTTQCCTDADCSGATPFCPSAGSTCVAKTATLTITLNYPANATISTISGTVNPPTTTLTTGTVAVTNGSKTVTGTGTTWATAPATYVVGDSFSIDGTNWYAITAVTNTSLTLSSKFLQGSRTGVATYYESDCNADAQNCTQNHTFSASVGTCGSTICTTTASVDLPVGVFSIQALGYDSSGRVEASAILPNKVSVTATGFTTPNLNLVRIFPIGTGSNATCPLNLAIDYHDNVWVVNGNGLSGSSCPAPSNNLSKLTKAATPPYNPTVITNSAISGSPEFIAADATNPYVWVTVPSLQNGIFQLYSDATGQTDGTTRNTYTAAGDNCVGPRGIDADPDTNGAYVACWGTTSTSGDGGRKIIKMDSTNTEAASFGFTDSTAQPVSLSYGRAFTNNSGTIYDMDYWCNKEIYINRSSATSVVVSRLTSSLGGLSSINQLTATDNPYGITCDGGGTSYTAARTTGDIKNFEYQNSSNSISQDSDNANAAAPTPWGLAVDDQYSYNYNQCAGVQAIAVGNIYASHPSLNTVSRFNNNPQTKLNDFIVGATSTPGPEGLIFDHTAGVVWVANSLENSLTRIDKNLMLFTDNCADCNPDPAANTACVATTAAGNSVTIAGNGFDTALATNNTVLLAGYMGKVTAVTSTSLTVTVQGAPSGITGPVIVANQGGQVVSLCTYTTQ